MAWTARGEDEKKEYFDSPEELEKKVSLLAEWVRESKHMIIFTVSVEIYHVNKRLWLNNFLPTNNIILSLWLHLFLHAQGAGISTSAGSKNMAIAICTCCNIN